MGQCQLCQLWQQQLAQSQRQFAQQAVQLQQQTVELQAARAQIQTLLGMLQNSAEKNKTVGASVDAPKDAEPPPKPSWMRTVEKPKPTMDAAKPKPTEGAPTEAPAMDGETPSKAPPVIAPAVNLVGTDSPNAAAVDPKRQKLDGGKKASLCKNW